MLRTLEITLQDCRYGLRGLIRRPFFAAGAILAMALGIGSTTAVFSVVDRILFRPLPYREADRIVSVGLMAPLDTNEFMFASEYVDLRRNPGPFTEITAFQAGTLDVDVNEQNPVRLSALRVPSDFLATLGIPLLHGRTFSPAEDAPNGPRAVILGYGVWHTRFASDPNAVGRTMMIDGRPAQIVGVLPRDFETPTLTEADLLLPMALDEAHEHQGRAFRVFARLKPGVGVREAVAQLGPHFARALQDVPPKFRKEVSLRVRPVRDRQTGAARVTSLALFGAVLAVLLIACLNIANLMLARAVSRAREMAVRRALGASRGRLLRQTMTESLLVAFAGAAAGCMLGRILLRVFSGIAPMALPRLAQASIDARVLGFALAASIVCGLLCGIAPALTTSSGNLSGGVRSTARESGARSILVTAQIAFSLVLLTAAGLLIRSLWKMEHVATGIEPAHVVVAHFVLGSHRYERPQDELAFFSELERRLNDLPGVEASAITDSVPPKGGTRGRPLAAIAVEGVEQRPEGTGGMVAWRYVTPGYFKTFGIPIVAGRGFSETDRTPDALPVIVSRKLARLLFGSGDPIGRHILRDPPNPWFTVIGVAADVKNRGPELASDPEFYLLRKSVPDAAFWNREPDTRWRSASAVVRTAISPTLAAASLRDAVRSMDATLPVEVFSMRQRMDEIHAPQRFNALLLALFAGIALVLAAVGVSGVMSYLVTQRRAEIGIRMALGATRANIAALAMGQAARWTAAGIVLGTIGSLVVTRALRSLLFEVDPLDPVAYIAALLVLTAAALIAATAPARRAAHVDPMRVLRHE